MSKFKHETEGFNAKFHRWYNIEPPPLLRSPKANPTSSFSFIDSTTLLENIYQVCGRLDYETRVVEYWNHKQMTEEKELVDLNSKVNETLYRASKQKMKKRHNHIELYKHPTDEEKNVGLWPYGTMKSPRNTYASGNHDVGFDCDVGIQDLLMPQGYDFGVWHQHLKKLTDYVTNLGKENHVLKKMEDFSELNHKIRVAYASHGDSMHPSNELDEDPQYHPTAKSQMPMLTDYVTNLGHENHVLKPKVAYLERKNQEVEEGLRVKLDKFDIKNQGRLLRPVVKSFMHKIEKPGATKSRMKVPDRGNRFEASIHIVEENSLVNKTPKGKGIKEK
ncbi:ion channel POLLUX-like 2 [Pyrus ussuriensis x Pyrus communis]|uniref:Ion channel POLLUX-like 2 n=1 Tax=Pyrus ussuriensis x Pyrus communis TaxID=2448454 RepID=A0A5N5EXN9_9ROSA|nr:ion channel POLLUX-like 2 [Pyrus ussuriensis x Pyrus communis]